MAKITCVLGRQPILGLAELESLYGPESLSRIIPEVVILDAETIDINRLGGVLKVGEVIHESSEVNLFKLQKTIETKLIPELLDFTGGKVKLGVSFYNSPLNTRQINAYNLSLKKIIKSFGRSVRIIPNVEETLSTAQVEHNNLLGESGIELLIIFGDSKTVVAKTTQIQDIDAYAARDQQRPKRDARIGMLPPKLAQIMINLANPEDKSWVLDPFCGTGVILQEALLMGFSAYGTDINERMVEYSLANLDWLKQRHGSIPEYLVEPADATSFHWPRDFSSVVSETYLGKPLHNTLSNNQLKIEINEVNRLTKTFLENLYNQLTTGSRLCIAIPAWRLNDNFISLPLLDQLEEIGYNHWSFKSVNRNELIYFRPNQLVARKLLVLIRK